jgi:hypothetical protein
MHATCRIQRSCYDLFMAHTSRKKRHHRQKPVGKRKGTAIKVATATVVAVLLPHRVEEVKDVVAADVNWAKEFWNGIRDGHQAPRPAGDPFANMQMGVINPNSTVSLFVHGSVPPGPMPPASGTRGTLRIVPFSTTGSYTALSAGTANVDLT